MEQTAISDKNGLIFAYTLNGDGSGREVGWQEIRTLTPLNRLLWVHLDYTGEEAQRWIREECSLDEVVSEALLAEETRPRSVMIHSGLLVVLRGVNLNPGSEPDDMVTIRMWIQEKRIITTQKRRVFSIEDLQKGIIKGEGPINSAEFLVGITDRLTDRIAEVIEDINDKTDELEEEIIGVPKNQPIGILADIRRQTINLRRYLAPQREAMMRLQTMQIPWLDEHGRKHLHEMADSTTRYIEDLDSARDRAKVTHEELTNQLSEQIGRRMYFLTVLAAVFLPVTFVTGLLGVNLGGIPGSDNPWAFIVVCFFLSGLVALEIWIFKLKKWL